MYQIKRALTSGFKHKEEPTLIKNIIKAHLEHKAESTPKIRINIKKAKKKQKKKKQENNLFN